VSTPLPPRVASGLDDCLSGLKKQKHTTGTVARLPATISTSERLLAENTKKVMSLRVGIIGAGQIVEDAHLPVLKAIEGATVTWIADIDKARSDLLSRMYHVRSIDASDISRAIADIDVCLIAIPLGARRDYIERCAETGVALYAEKPFARTVEEHGRYCRLFPEYKLAAGFQRRLYHTTHIIREIIAGQYFSKLNRVAYSIGQYSVKSGGATKFVTDPVLSGGGFVIESAIHGLDQILLATGADDITVESAGAVVFNNIDYQVTTLAALTASDHKVSVECEMTRLRNLRQEFDYHFDNATVSFGLAPASPLAVTGVDRSAQVTLKLEIGSAGAPRDSAFSVNQAFYLFWSMFLQGIASKETNITSASKSLLTTQWVEGIYRAILP